ncbi:MAG: hypothetical protein Q9227_004783 [Pyrenula ochraceoflavens]
MGKPPAIVIIVRHGARLDAADKQWHLTSPTPYDPPLTYGGWTQCRSLGARIANILDSRIEQHHEDDKSRSSTSESKQVDGNSAQPPPKPKKHKIIIHSSPFVRCIQTSIAISAGIGQNCQNRPVVNHPNLKPRSQPVSTNQHDTSQKSADSPISRETPAPFPDYFPSPNKLHIATLRVDAFLGEWLSPDYYEQITPPPSSVMMVAGAKSDLLRPAENIVGFVQPASPFHYNSPGGWNRNWREETSDESAPDSALAGAATVRQSLPYRSRANTEAHGSPASGKDFRESVKFDREHSNTSLYNPPSPAYAISSSDPIPTGYVAHARDACVDVDYQWDSMRPPYDWGDGGEFGEEWSSMHKRFRNGLERMISWYGSHDIQNGLDARATDQNYDNTDTVLILVTHGAGCNALLGALTNQPVLLDVGMASLTVAERKTILQAADFSDKRSLSSTSSLSGSKRRSSLDSKVASEYEMKIVASTDHLRVRSTRASPALTHSPRGSQTLNSFGRRARSSISSVEGVNLRESLGTRPPTGSPTHRGSNGSLGLRWGTSKLVRSSTGLWGSTPSTPQSDGLAESVEDIIPNFDRAGLGGVSQPQSNTGEQHDSDRYGDGALTTADGQGGLWEHRNDNDEMRIEDLVEENDNVPDHIVTPKRIASQRGLWSCADSPARSGGPKRRWTVTHEHGT